MKVCDVCLVTPMLTPSVVGKDIRTAVRELRELPPSKELDLPPTTGGPARELLKKLGIEPDL